MTDDSLSVSDSIRASRWGYRWLSMILFAVLCAASYTFLDGRSPIRFPLSADGVTMRSGHAGGEIALTPDSHLKLDIASAWRPGGIRVRFDFTPRPAFRSEFVLETDSGLVSLSIDANELSGNNHVKRTADIAITADRFAVEIDQGKTAESVDLKPGTVRSLSVKSVISVDNLSVSDPSGKRIDYRNDFGHGLFEPRPFFLLLAFAVPLLFLFRFIESRFFFLIGLTAPGRAQKTFIAGYLPLCAGIFFLDWSAFALSLFSLLLAAAIWRPALLTLENRAGKTAYIWAVLFPLAVAPPAFAFSGGGEWPTNLIIFLCLAFLVFIQAVEIIFWKRSGDASLPGALRFASLPLLFLASAQIGRLTGADHRELALLGALGLTGFAAGKFALVRTFGKSLRGSQALMLFWIFAAAVGLELAARQAAFAQGWTPYARNPDFDQHEVLFWAPKNLFIPTGDFDRRGDLVVSKINFRSGPVSPEIPPGAFRVLIIGGSNVYGDGLTRLTDTWGSKLENLLNARGPVRYEVVNAGVKGYSLFQLLLLLKTYLKDTRFDVLLLYLNFNDIRAAAEFGPFTYRELWEARTSGHWDKIESFMTAHGLAERRSWVLRTQDVLQNFRLYNGLTRTILEFRGRRTVSGFGKPFMKSVNPKEDYVKNLEETIDLARARGAKVLLTTEFQWTDPRTADSVSSLIGEYNDTMQQTALRKNAAFCDTHAQMRALQKSGADLVFDWDKVHMNPAGTTKLAELMKDCLEKNRLLP